MVKKRKIKNDFVQAVWDIHKLATQRMDSRERKQFLEGEAVKLGAKKQKNQKIPYNIYQGIQRKKKEEEQNRKEDEKASGMATTPYKKQQAKKFEKQKDRHVKQKIKGKQSKYSGGKQFNRSGGKNSKHSVGKLRGGVLHLNKKALNL